MGLLRAIKTDVLDSATRYAWLEGPLRSMPGTLGQLLRRTLLRRRLRSAGEGLLVMPGVRIHGPGSLSVGRNCRIGYDVTIQANGDIQMGDEIIIGPGVKIWSVNHVFARLDVPIWDQGFEHKPVVIGNGVWIGANSFIMPGARIGDHVIVSAGSVVSGKAVEPYSIIAGNPARRVGTRQERVAAQPAPAEGLKEF